MLTADDTVQALAKVLHRFTCQADRVACPGASGSDERIIRALFDSGLVVPAAPVDGEDELAVMLRRAVADPGQYTMRYKDSDGDYELLHLWQARAAMIAVRPLLAACDAAVQLAETRFSFGTAAIKDRERAEADLAAARQQLDQVRALHFTRDRWCTCCGADWPCATVRALGAVPADETGGAT